ncbi:MAG: transposase [Atopobiaceae bacterium]|nr:transposase [Atopobiaceae bacterium]
MRTARKQSASEIYHVMTRGTGRQRIFEDIDDRMTFIELLERAKDKTDTSVFAWCLMENHVHLLVQSPMERLSKLMGYLLGEYARQFNQKTGRVGHLFQDRYKSEPVEDDTYLLTVICYIHQNPQMAGIAKMSEYPWSSYHEYTGKPRVCSTDFALEVFGGVEQFKTMHRQTLTDSVGLEANKPRSATRPMPERMVQERVAKVLGSTDVSTLKELPKGERDELLRKLKQAGLSIRQIERLTGIGRGVIARI